MRLLTFPRIESLFLRQQLDVRVQKPLRDGAWDAARLKVQDWLDWGQMSPLLANDDVLNRDDVTVQQAIGFFFKFGERTHTKGDAAKEKYEVLHILEEPSADP